MRCVSVVFRASILVTVVVAFSSVSAQTSVKESTEPERNASAQGEAQYSEASLKFDILEAQLQTLRKKMQLRTKTKAQQTKEWNEHYERVKQQIEAWDDFVDSYGVK